MSQFILVIRSRDVAGKTDVVKRAVGTGAVSIEQIVSKHIRILNVSRCICSTDSLKLVKATTGNRHGSGQDQSGSPFPDLFFLLPLHEKRPPLFLQSVACLLIAKIITYISITQYTL